MPKVVGKIDIEALVKKQDTIKAASIRNAIARQQELKAKEEEDKVLEYLSNIQRNTEAAVNLLKNARAKEKKAKAYLMAVASAEQQFMVDADYIKYSAAVRAATYAL